MGLDELPKRIVSAATLTLLLLCAFSLSIGGTIPDEERVIRIIDAETGSSLITVGSETTPLPPEGYSFTVNVTLEGATNYLHKYQVSLAFDKNKVKCTGAWITLTDPNSVFYEESGPIMITVAVYNDLGFAAVGSMLPSDYIVPDHEAPRYVNVSKGLLGQFNFTAINTSTSALEIVPTGNLDHLYDTFLLDKDKQNINFVGESFSLTVLGSPILPATIDINPRTLNLKSKGKWITAYIELSKGYDARDINASSILLNDTVPAVTHPICIGDEDCDGISDLMVKFNRTDVIEYILNSIDKNEKFTNATLTITGKHHSGTMFKGNDTVRVIVPGKSY